MYGDFRRLDALQEIGNAFIDSIVSRQDIIVHDGVVFADVVRCDIGWRLREGIVEVDGVRRRVGHHACFDQIDHSMDLCSVWLSLISGMWFEVKRGLDDTIFGMALEFDLACFTKGQFGMRHLVLLRRPGV